MSATRHRALTGWAMALAAVLCANAVQADDVFLENGNAFEGVIVVSETEKAVKIRLAYGEMSLPRSWIERIERAESPLEIYLERRSLLRADAEARAEDWLELARWGRGRELAHGYKEALLEAAMIDPRHPELAVHMRSIDYVLDSDAGLWVSAAELRREALEAERLAAARARAAEARERPTDHDSTTEQTLSRAVEVLAMAELERETRQTRESEGFGSSHRHQTFYPVQTAGHYGAVYPVAYFPGVVAAPGQGDGSATAPVSDPYASLRRRQPGSLLVTKPGGSRVSSLSRVRRQPGALPLGRP